MPASISIQNHRIGPGQPCFIIAEAGVNHNGSLELALQLVDAAKKAGADAVKFQTFSTDALVAPGTRMAQYQQANTGGTESQDTMLRRLELSREAHVRLIERCAQLGLVFLSTPFDDSSLELLLALGVVAFKVSSGDANNHPFLVRLASFGKPIMLSTGMATMAEVDQSVRLLEARGNPPLALLHCVSSYPAPPESLNLRAIQTLKTAFSLPVGYSDHSDGAAACVTAVALGACILEKHLTIDRTLPGPDHRASMEIEEFTQLCRDVRMVENALGDGRKCPHPCEADTAAVARKSLVLRLPVAAGHIIPESALTARRPQAGLSPALMTQVTGRRARTELPAGHVLDWSDID